MADMVPEDFEPMAAMARCVTPFGLATVVDYSASTHSYKIAIDGGATAYLQVEVVAKEFVPELGDKVATPYGTGLVTAIEGELYSIEMELGAVAYLQRNLVFPTIEPFGLSVSMLPAEFQSKMLAYTGVDTSKGAGYIGKGAELLQEAQVAWSRFYATNAHLVRMGQETMGQAYEATKDLRSALEKAFEDLGTEAENSAVVQEGRKKLEELKSEFTSNTELVGFVDQVDSIDKLTALAQSQEATKIMDRLKFIAESVGNSDTVKDLMDAATPKIAALQDKLQEDSAALLESAPDALDSHKKNLFSLSSVSVEKAVKDFADSEDAKSLLAKGEQLMSDFGIKKDDLDTNKLLQQATEYIPQVTSKATELFTEHGQQTYETAAALLDQHKGVTDVVMQQLQKHGGQDGNISANALLSSAASYVEQVDEQKITEAIGSLDLKEWQEWGEKVATDDSERQKLVNRVKDNTLDFLLQYLPSIEVPPIQGEKEEVEYTIGNIDLGGFKIKKEGVDVQLGNFKETGEIISVVALDIQAHIPKLKWSFKQGYFPYMNGNGFANADVHNAEVRLGFKLERVVVDGENQPRLALLAANVEMSNLTISIEGSWFSWVYNVLTAIFSQVIQEYICATLTDKMLEHMSTLLESLNTYASGYWPIILKHADVKLDALPLAAEGTAEAVESKLPPCGANEVDVIIEEKGSLGLRLDSTGKAQYATVVGFSKMADGSKGPAEKTGKIKMGQQLVAVNGRMVDEMAQSEVVRLMRLQRPLTLRFRAATGLSAKKNEYEVTFEPGPIGLKVQPRPQGTAAVVSGFKPGPNGEQMPAESCAKIKVGDVMVGINGSSLREKQFDETMDLFKKATRPITLSFLYNADFAVRFNEWPPALKIACLGATDDSPGHIVVTGFESLPGAAEKGGQIQIGDVVEAIAGRPVLAPAAPRDLAYPQVIRMLKAAKMKLKGKSGLFFSVRFMRPPKSSKKDDKEKEEDRGPSRQGRSYDISFDEGPLGIVFGVTEDGRTCVKKFAALKGPAESSGLVRAGLVLLQVNKQDVPPGNVEAAMQMLSEASAPCSLKFRDMERTF